MYADSPARPCYQHALPWFYASESQRMISGPNRACSNGGSFRGNFIRDVGKAEFIHKAVLGVTTIQALSVEEPLHTENFPST